MPIWRTIWQYKPCVDCPSTAVRIWCFWKRIWSQRRWWTGQGYVVKQRNIRSWNPLRLYLHVSSLCSFYSSVHQTFTASHGMKKELSGRQARVEAVGHKAFSSRQLERKTESHQQESWGFLKHVKLIYMYVCVSIWCCPRYWNRVEEPPPPLDKQRYK